LIWGKYSLLDVLCIKCNLLGIMTMLLWNVQFFIVDTISGVP
jgi:hypothetical protein